MPGEVDTLNHFTSIASSAQSVLALQYETLAGYDANNELVPAMADKWDTSTDGKVWTFHMPEGRKWSDDQPITAKDTEWTFSSIQSNDALKQANGTLVENVESVVAKDAQTLVMTLKNAQAPNPGSQLPIMPEHIWSKAADPSKFANDKDDVGSGPFVVVSYDKSAGVTMKANPNYRLGKAKVDGLIWVPYKNSDAAVQALKTGEVDVVGRLTATQFEALKDQPGITTNSGKT
ncbi:oligopeptide-binding protein [Renibacterium salmoninarum ATCC 33209]|uniref:Oligopeptide-binding protein n=2 Tax=Renibacterium salmoninarum TaxID=1646 RepID=A9WLS2_RENSM|nr:oligopeptide-binding protein [Renibacterium salmoninarum ATCC 33209]